MLALDGITLRDFDFVDLGRVQEPSGTVPITIKSLVFQSCKARKPECPRCVIADLCEFPDKTPA